MRFFIATVLATFILQTNSFFLASRGLSNIQNRLRDTCNHVQRKNFDSLRSRKALFAVAKKTDTTADGEKKPKAVKKVKAVADDSESASEPKKAKKVVKAKDEKTDSEEPTKKPKVSKVIKAADSTAKAPKVKSTKISAAASEKSLKDDLEGNDMFDLKELLGDDFLSEGEGMGLLPNLDEDLAKLEANLSELGDFGFDFRDDDDDDEALRSIESGQFDIEEFLKDGADDVDDLLSDMPGLMKKGGSESSSTSAGRAKKIPEPNKKKKEKALQPTLQQAMKNVEVDDDDERLDEEESVSDQVLEELALSLGLGGDDLMDVDFDAEDDGDDDVPIKMMKKSLLDGSDGMNKDGITALEGLDGMLENDKLSVSPLVIDGLEVDREGLELGVEPPPLEEFKRLMESLGPDSMFADDYADSLAADEYVQPDPIPVRVFKEPNDKMKVWLPLVYEGGKSARVTSKPEVGKSLDWWLIDHEGAAPSDWRVQVISVVTNSSNVNTTALDMVNMVYDHIQRGLTPEENERVSFQILCYEQENGEPMEEMEDSIQMWLESYNTYHLVDGAAMKEAWGSIMPHIMLAEKNLNAILDQVRWALAEDTFEGALLTPRLRRLRFRGGAQEMTTGFNTEHLDSEFSVVSVR